MRGDLAPLAAAAAAGAAALLATLFALGHLRPAAPAPAAPPPPPPSGALPWAGRAVLVTGASSGIGRACAVRFASLGARVGIHFSSNEAGARETLRLCAAAAPGGGASASASAAAHALLRADLGGAGERVEDAALRLVGEAEAAFGLALCALVLNAGVFCEAPLDAPAAGGGWRAELARGGGAGGAPPLADFMRDWRRTLALNLEAPAALTFVFARALLAARAGFSAAPGAPPPAVGAIVTVGSRGALRGEPRAWAYGASKAGAHALAQSAAVALGRHGVVCAAVAPGFVATRMARLAGPAGAAIAAQSPWARVATPEEVASSVDFAARFFENPWTSGAVIACNGASHLHS